LISENHHANIQDNEKAKRIEELISDIVTDYVKHLNYPVTLQMVKQLIFCTPIYTLEILWPMKPYPMFQLSTEVII
jgi:hypothetical protein